MTGSYEFAGFRLALHGNWLNHMEGLPVFLSDNSQDLPDLELYAEAVNSLPLPQPDAANRMVGHQRIDDMVTLTLCVSGNLCLARLILSGDGRSGCLQYVRTVFEKEPGGAEILVEKAVHALLLKRSMLFLHCAAVAYRDGGILFTAPSGTGKTTQAEIWKASRGAEVINGDRPVLWRQHGNWVVSGTPWSGSSGDYVKKDVPIRCIVVLQQAQENKVARLSPKEAVVSVLPRFYLPYEDDASMRDALDLADAVCREIPVWKLACRPDFHAAQVLWDAIVDVWPHGT